MQSAGIPVFFGAWKKTKPSSVVQGICLPSFNLKERNEPAAGSSTAQASPCFANTEANTLPSFCEATYTAGFLNVRPPA